MTDLQVLIIGSGGREHALARAINADPGVRTVHVAPGNPGTAQFATNHPVDANDPSAVTELATTLGVDLVVVGPEAPLVAGVADALRAAGIAVFGPDAAAARLEGSKQFAKGVMAAAGVPTAESIYCTTPEQVRQACQQFGAPYVVKADGLAAGKGVVVTDDLEAAVAHGADAGTVVVEQFLDGPEVSLFVITDGTTCLPLRPAQDFKRANDEDQGPNTGGMGAYSPLPWLADHGFTDADALAEHVVATIAEPTLAELARRDASFSGLLYCGLALTSNGVRVIEFNARFGDPETQVLLGLLDSPLGQVLHAAATGTLATTEPLRWRDQCAVGVVLAAEGYPASPRTGEPLSLPPDVEDAWVIQAGTTNADGQLHSSGGRVLTVVGRGSDLSDARAAAYHHLGLVDLPGSFHRSDIAALAAADQHSRKDSQ